LKLTRIAKALALSGLAGMTGHALAQTPPATQPQKLERVTITGSSIKRLADQKALPIDTFSRADIERRGLTDASELVEMLSANVAGANNPTSTNTVFGPDQDRLTGGSSFANLRGLGPTGTLVLLNGRRVSTAGMSGGAVDLNAIPMDAVERVEVLKDGASAIYGTDAIGGVINFITRSDYQGFAARASYSTPEAKGGGQRARASLAGGIGSLARDGWNVMGSVTLDNNRILRGIDRDWATGFQPERYLSPDSSSSWHANIRTVAGTALGTGGSVVGTTDPTRYTVLNLLAIQGRCQDLEYQVPMAPNMEIWNRTYPASSSRYACTRDYGRNFMLSSPKKASNVLLKGSVAVSENHKERGGQREPQGIDRVHQLPHRGGWRVRALPVQLRRQPAGQFKAQQSGFRQPALPRHARPGRRGAVRSDAADRLPPQHDRLGHAAQYLPLGQHAHPGHAGRHDRRLRLHGRRRLWHGRGLDPAQARLCLHQPTRRSAGVGALQPVPDGRRDAVGRCAR
jgi:hypothetical protein